LNVSLRSPSRWIRVARAILAACLLVPALAGAAPPSVERFDAVAWERLQKELPRPAVVVFTATYCASCPAVLEKLSRTLEARERKGEVVAVVIDEADERELLGSKHYVHASRLFVFDGNEASLRYRVDPRWRGVTPYVALLPAQGPLQFVPGTPTDAQLAQWIGK
jgi:thiol-disulfide isomerase/thioredoxin